MIRKELIYIDMWYPWANQLIIDNKTFNITDEVNVVLYDIYECNSFHKKLLTRKYNFPKGPYEISIITVNIKCIHIEVIIKIEYMGMHRMKHTKQRDVRKLIENDRANAKEWLLFERGEREKLKEQNSVVGGNTRKGVKNTVKIWEKMLL